MSQLYCTGLVMSDLELKTSQKNVPYTRNMEALKQFLRQKAGEV